ncbi:MAG: T9SS type A sorting domain-containing protein [Ferruginibacter sp.]
MPGKERACCQSNIIISEQPFSADIYPNPTHSSFRIKTSLRNKGLMIVTISDVQGKIIRKYNISGDSMPNMGEDLIPGVYYVEIQTGIDKVIRKLVRL